MLNKLNLDLNKFYEDTSIERFNQKVADGLMQKGEKYVRLPYEREHIIIISYGRAINTHLVKQFSMRISAHTFHLYVTGLKISLPEIFEEQGWKFNFNKLKRNYIKYKWHHQDTSKYSYYEDKAK